MAVDPRIDQFIAEAQPFAQPILSHLRSLVQATVPAADETIKWAMPHFVLEEKILCGMGSFKAHCAFIIDDAGSRGGEGMGHFGRIRSLDELPGDEVLRELLLNRASRIISGETSVTVRGAKPETPVPDDLAAVLSAEAALFLKGLAPSARREFVDWIVEAKRPETRAKRIVEAAALLAAGRKRYDKYRDC